MTDKSGPDEGAAGSGVPVEKTAAEAKRLAARRRFLLGGASALPLIVTLGQKEAWAASAAVCQSLNMSYDAVYVDAHNGNAGLAASLYCDPDRIWG